jgi:hypothetical protein
MGAWFNRMHATYNFSEHLHYQLTPSVSPCKPRYLQKNNKLSVLIRKRLSKEIGHREPYHANVVYRR